MNKEQTNNFLTLLMGKGWEEDKYPWWCESCKIHVSDSEVTNNEHHEACGGVVYTRSTNLDFFIPATFREWMIWAGGHDWFYDMLWDICKGKDNIHTHMYALQDRKIHKFYTKIEYSLEQQIKWFKKCKKLWGYEDCPECKGYDCLIEKAVEHNNLWQTGDKFFPCKNCNKGKVKNKALEYLEEVKSKILKVILDHANSLNWSEVEK